jgi:glycosyltransferase involved in cell wall biosynthesis
MRRRLSAIILGPLGPPFGGPEIMTRTLVDALARRGDIDFVHIDTQVSRSLAEKGGQNQGRKLPLALIHLLKLLWLAIRRRPDVIYLPLTNSPSFLGFVRDAAAIAVARLTRSRVAIRLHGGYYYYVHTKGWRRRLVNAVLSRVDLASVQGGRLVSCFDGAIPENRVEVIPNGIDDAPFLAARARQSSRTGVPQVLFVGLLGESKGFHDIIAAMPGVPAANFVFMGEWGSPEDRDRAYARLRADGTEARAQFTGVVSGDRKYDLFASSDVFAFPTYWIYEGHAVSTVEALAAGLPIVCTDHGALNESVRDGWNGFFVPRHDPDRIAARLRQLFGDPGLCREMGSRSRKLYEDRFTVDRFVTRWTESLIAATSSGTEAHP